MCIFYILCNAKSLQSCLTLCNPIDGSPPGSPIPGILQARILEWVAISFSNAWKWKGKVKSPCSARLLATPWTPAYQAPPSMGFSRQEYWSGVPLPSLIFYIIPFNYIYIYTHTHTHTHTPFFIIPFTNTFLPLDSHCLSQSTELEPIIHQLLQEAHQRSTWIP